MAKYKQKTPEFDALQFDGSSESATQIIQGVMVLSPTYLIRYQPETSEFGLIGGSVAEFKTETRLKIENTNDGSIFYAHVGSWVVVDQNGVVSVCTNSAFTQTYQGV